MTSPSVITATKAQTAFSATQTLTYPAGIQANDWLACVLAVDGGPAPGTFINAFPTGWAKLSSYERGEQITVSTCIAVKKCDGTETGNFNVTLSQAQPGAWIIVLIRGADPDVAPASVVWQRAVAGTANPDSPNASLAASKDMLALSLFGCNNLRTVSAYPTNMSHYQNSQPGASTSAASVGVAGHQLTGTSFNPNSFTLNASATWACWTILFQQEVTPIGTGTAAGSSTAQAFSRQSHGLAAGSCSVWGFRNVFVQGVGAAAGSSLALGVGLPGLKLTGVGLSEGVAEAEAVGISYRLFWIPEDPIIDPLNPPTPDTDIWIPEEPY